MDKDIIIRYTHPAEIHDYVIEYRWNTSQTINIYQGDVTIPSAWTGNTENVTVREFDIITFAERPSFDEVLETVAEHFSEWCDQVLADNE